LSFAGRDDVEPVRKVLADESDAPVSFFTEREAQIAAFDWAQDIRQDALTRHPLARPGPQKVRSIASTSAPTYERFPMRPGRPTRLRK